MTAQTHVVLENDCPYEAQDDGRLAIDDVRNVYVDQFNLRGSRRQWRSNLVKPNSRAITLSQ